MPAQVGRADLLRALHLGCAGPLALEHTDAEWCGYVPRDLPAASNTEQAEVFALQFPGVRRMPAPVINRPKARSALRMPEVWVAERIDPQADPEPQPPPEHRTHLSAEELQPPDEPAVAYQDLVPLPRLARPLAAQLQRPQLADVDIAALLRASARRHWPRRLPRLTRQRWPSRLVLMLDVSIDLFPYHYDMYRVQALLQARVPRAQMQVWAGAHGPFGPWENLCADPGQAMASVQPQPGCTYLLVSDLGLLRPASDPARAWQRWLQQAQARKCACVTLAPVASEDVSPELAAVVRLLRWSPGSRLRPERGRPETDAAATDHDHARSDYIRSDHIRSDHIRSDHARDDQASAALRELLACLSATLRMDPPLLRALRQNGSAPLDASLEGRLWAHPEVRSTTYACLYPEFLERRQADLRTQSEIRRAAFDQACVHHHSHWPLGMQLVDGMQQLAALRPTQSERLDRTRDHLHRLTQSLKAEQGDPATLENTADYVLRRAPAEVRPLVGDALDALMQARGQPIGARQRWRLLQRGQQLCIAPAASPKSDGPGVVLCHDLGMAAAGEWVLLTQPQQPAQYLPLPIDGALALPPLREGACIALGGGQTRLSRRKRTRGVLSWQQSDTGVVERLDLSWFEKRHASTEGLIRGVALLPDHDGRDALVDIDRDEYGMVLSIRPDALLRSAGLANPFIRFRYLEPATFLQGSPDGEGHGDEHPQHSVTLTQGLWLAETPCTQALWQAVMGRNPSHFKQGKDAPLRPVENVSWDDVQSFLHKLTQMLPAGCEAVLPTESQWEYACRAGTQTEYWWGDAPDQAKANFDMEGERSWDDKEGTTPVNRYPPNPLGLFDMHGNVWEWCADGLRDYTAEAARDPEGPTEGPARVVRGGSWLYHPVDARAAYRLGRFRDDAYRIRGFRFALRSSSRPEAGSGGPREAGKAGAAGGRTAGADAPVAKPAQPRMGKFRSRSGQHRDP
ncbi:MAG: hypothetical protein E6Q88_05010 [Lysobacteraceae bacterium]|nr:MAG: hypothetical protein E6Q88_05010 [Xanthomonadaceae bacterium]